MRQEWRCIGCTKLLGVLAGDRLHIRFGKGHEYLVGFPVTGTCRHCNTLNELLCAEGKETKVVSERR